MPRLRPCTRCGRHVRSTSDNCPHCDAVLETPSVGPRGAALGLALASTVACSGGIGPGEPEYGVAVMPDTSEVRDTGDTADTSEPGDSGDSGDSDDSGDDDTGEFSQAEYGVPCLSEH